MDAKKHKNKVTTYSQQVHIYVDWEKSYYSKPLSVYICCLDAGVNELQKLIEGRRGSREEVTDQVFLHSKLHFQLAPRHTASERKITNKMKISGSIPTVVMPRQKQ